jgi:NCAIR mutase (PurE)-related protein
MKKIRKNKVKVRTHKAFKVHKAHKLSGHRNERHRKIATVAGGPAKASESIRPARPIERTKGQSALATTVAEDELEERRRLFAKARKGDKGAVAKIYELYGARIYTTAQVKEVQPNGFVMPVTQSRKRVRTA